MKVAAAILAAGASTRLGRPKQLVELGGEKLLERAVRLAFEAGCEPVFVILGYQCQEIASQCKLGSATIVENQAWSSGMASSIHAALQYLPATAQALLLTTCDQPAADADHLRKVIATALQSAGGTAGSRYRGKVGVPACFQLGRFPDLARLEGDQGARNLLSGNTAVDLTRGEIDIDTKEDLARAKTTFGLT